MQGRAAPGRLPALTARGGAAGLQFHVVTGGRPAASYGQLRFVLIERHRVQLSDKKQE